MLIVRREYQGGSRERKAAGLPGPRQRCAEALNISKIYTHFGFSTPVFKAIGFDGSVRDL